MSYIAKDLAPQVRGDDWTFKLTITSSGAPVDVTGYTYFFTLKGNASDPDPGDLQIIQQVSGADAENGIVYIKASRTDTYGLNPQAYNYDIQQQDTTGSVKTLMIGKLKVVQDITRTV